MSLEFRAGRSDRSPGRELLAELNALLDSQYPGRSARPGSVTTPEYSPTRRVRSDRSATRLASAAVTARDSWNRPIPAMPTTSAPATTSGSR